MGPAQNPFEASISEAFDIMRDGQTGEAKAPTVKPSAEPVPGASVDVEVFAKNLARMVEEGGKALAAYLKPREEGKIANETGEDVADVVRTLGHVAEYWLA